MHSQRIIGMYGSSSYSGGDLKPVLIAWLLQLWNDITLPASDGWTMVKNGKTSLQSQSQISKKFIWTHTMSKAGFTASSSLQGLSEWDANKKMPPKPSPNASACGLVLFQIPPATRTAGSAPLALLAHPQNLLFHFQVLFLPLPLKGLHYPCYPCLQKWSSGELFCTKKPNAGFR